MKKRSPKSEKKKMKKQKFGGLKKKKLSSADSDLLQVSGALSDKGIYGVSD